jgi:ribosome biogenesis GTPase A
METLEKITVFCYGETGVGKSYFLNMLCGNEGDNDDPFKTAATCDSVTKNPKIVESHIFGNKQAPIIRIMDIPGIFDTEDLDAEKSNKQPVSIDHLKNLNKTVQEQFGGKVNRILVCFDATKRFGKL